MSFEFIADRPVLDFVATVAERGTTNLEKLARPADLVSWVGQSGIVDNVPSVDPVAFQHAITLREALFRAVSGLISGVVLTEGDRRIINDAAGRPYPLLHLSDDGDVSRSGDLHAVLAVVTRDLLDLYRSSDRQHLRWCDDPRCTRPFIDRSRGQQRRWCGMQGCGDRAKAAAYRRRRRTATAGQLPRM